MGEKLRSNSWWFRLEATKSGNMLFQPKLPSLACKQAGADAAWTLHLLVSRVSVVWGLLGQVPMLRDVEQCPCTPLARSRKATFRALVSFSTKTNNCGNPAFLPCHAGHFFNCHRRTTSSSARTASCVRSPLTRSAASTGGVVIALNRADWAHFDGRLPALALLKVDHYRSFAFHFQAHADDAWLPSWKASPHHHESYAPDSRIASPALPASPDHR